MDGNNNWLLPDGHEQIDFYIRSSDVILIERYRCIKLLLDIFNYHFESNRKLRLLDIGCGDGIVTKNIQKCHPQHEFHVLDGSAAMLDEARKSLGDTCAYIHRSFEDFIREETHDQQYDFIFSSLALHHLDWNEKSGMYAKAFRLLRQEGLFLNIDTVLPPSERSEAWQFMMWRDWINETLEEMGKETGRHDNLPAEYKRKPENKPSDLFRQIDLLRANGFRDVDCYYKYGVFALYGGTK